MGYVKLIGAVAVALVLVLGYFYITGLQNDLAAANAKIGGYQAAVAVQNATIGKLSEAHDQRVKELREAQESVERLTGQYNESRQEIDSLREQFSELKVTRDENGKAALSLDGYNRLSRMLEESSRLGDRRHDAATGGNAKGVPSAASATAAPP